MKILNVAVVMGGISPEHDISIQSGATVLANLPAAKFNSKAVVIQKNGLWCLSDDAFLIEDLCNLKASMRPEIALGKLIQWGIDVAFLALHGPNGEDGSIQGFFKAAGVPFTGSSVEACAASMNKYTSKVIASWAGLNTPESILLSHTDWINCNFDLSNPMKEIGFPSFVKTLHSGSSIGVHRVNDLDELKTALEMSFELDTDVLIEKEIRGREITCGVLYSGQDEMEVLPPVEIIPKGNNFFDFNCKYNADQVEEVCPAPIRDEEWDTLKIAALSISKRIGAKGISRIDFILNDDGLWFLELNAIPGLTQESIVLKEAKAAGLSLETLMEKLIYPVVANEEELFKEEKAD